uniref:Microtubule-actin cross-linking factor 1 n=1 Tax=Parascaris univalens TaxID=6257 RepID=A0A915B3J8_PARUN
MSTSSAPFSPQGYSSDVSSNYYYTEAAENECLEHYEINLEKHKDERDAIQKKTFTKWVNKHLGKTGRQVGDLFVDLSDGFNLIALLEALSAEKLPRENGYTRFHRIQNVQYCLDFLKRKNVRTVNIRPEDIVEGNSKLTLGLIWTIILNFQVSVIKQRQLESSSCQVSEVLSSVDGVSARDALLQWAQDVTRGYPGVNVRNFTSSWRDGLAFNAILHRYRPNLIQWSKISDESVSARERLDNAFAAAESEFGVSRLLDAEDVDVETPDEKSIITYVSSLYNALPHTSELNKGSLADIISRLTRGIGITNEKLDHILKRIEDAESRIDSSRPAELQRIIDAIIDDLVALESPILGFFEDVDQLKQSRHPEANDFYQQVYGLEQRRQSYMSRLRTQFMTRLGIRSETLIRESEQRRESIRRSTFGRVDECIQWVRVRLEKLTEMEFVEDLEQLESMFEEHKLDNHDIQDFRQNVDECIARQAEVSAEDTHEYCELLSTLESEYQQLRDLSAGRMLDLDTLIAFVRGAQQEIVWINEREDIEVTRNWSDINQLDLPMLQNYYKQLLHEIELREPRFNDVHNKGAALLNQGHPAVHVIEFYLNAMQRKWDWLLALSKCLEQHLRDAINLKSFMEDAAAAEDWMVRQTEMLERKYNRSDFSLEEGEQLLRELDEINELIKKYHGVLMTLTERSSQISPLWQRGERIQRPIPVTALADYADRNITIREGDECVLMDNSDLIHWIVRGSDGAEASVPSVVFRIPPPDARLTAYLNRLHTNFEKLRRIWEKKHRMVRFNMVLNTMAQIRGWDLDTFLSIDPDQRDAIIKALNDDAHKLLAELDPNDPLALRLKEELRLTNEHFYNLLNQSMRPKEPDIGSQFDARIAELLKKLEDAYRKLNDRVAQGVPRSPDELERLILEHKDFEEALQALDVDVSTVKELFRQIQNPTPSQRANHDHLCGRWEDLWELSRMYVERLKALEGVLNGIGEVSDIVKQHEITLNSFDDMPAALDKLRGVHSQLLEMNMVLQQQQSVVDSLNRNIALLRQHISRTRQTSSHPDVDRLEDEVQMLTVRWENVCSQVAERLKSAERALQTQMVYRSEYDNEISWLDRVEATINSLRRPEDMRPEQYQAQLDLLIAEYAQLQERTEAIENVNREGGKFIREAKGYDSRLIQYLDTLLNIHGPAIRGEFRRTEPQPKNGAQQVTEELERLNRRFAQLSSLILEKRNVMQVLIQNWKRQKQEDLHNECLSRQANMSAMLDSLNEMAAAVSERFALVTSSESAAVAHDRMKDMRNELLSWAANIEENIAEADRLCTDGAEMLTPEQFHALKEHRNRLETTYNQLMRHTDSVLQRLSELTKLLLEFSNESSSMHSFLNEKTREVSILRAESGDPQNLAESRYRAKAITDEVSANETRLKGISSLAAHIQSELDAYVVEMRVQYPDAQIPSTDAHELSSTLTRLQTDYELLVRGCQDLIAFLNRLNSLAVTHVQNVDNVLESLSRIESEIFHAEKAAIASDVTADSSTMSKMLKRMEELQHTSLEQAALMESALRSAADLNSALVGTDAHERIALENQRQLDDFQRRHSRNKERIEEDIDSWRSKITRNEGIRKGMSSILDWLTEEEKRVALPRQLPLSVEKLADLRREDELVQRELSSRQKVLVELGTEISKAAAENPSSTAARNLLEQFQGALKNFTPLAAIVKARAENVGELSAALARIGDAEKALNEKLITLGEQLAYVAPADVESLGVIRDTLSTIVNDDWRSIQKQHKWILAVPDITETESLNRSVDRMGQTLEKMSTRVDELTIQGEALGSQRKEFNELHAETVTWLEAVENNAQDLNRVSLNPVELANQRNACTMLQSEHQEHRPQLEQLEDLGTKLVEIETLARTKLKGSGGKSEEAQNTLRELTTIRQRYDALGAQLKSRSDKISANSEKLAEWDLTRDALARWASHEAKRLEAECPVALTHDDIQSNLSKVDRVEKVCQKEKQPLMEEVRAKARYLLTDMSLPGVNEIQSAQVALENDWHTLAETLESVKEKTQSSKRLIQGCGDLDKWLRQKERMMSVIGTINIDPKVINSQLIQIELLAGEMEDQTTLRTKVNELAHELVTSLSPDFHSQKVIEMMDGLNLRWIALQEGLETKKENLLKAKETSMQFSNLQREIRSSLLEVAEEVEEASRCPLSSASDFEEHIAKLDALGAKGVESSARLEQLKKLAEAIGDVVDDPALQSDIREQLNVISQSARELNRKIESLKNAAVSAKAEEGETVRELENLLKWMKDMKGQLADIGPISADSRILQEQSKQVDEIYRNVLDKEGDVTILRAKLAEQLRKTPNAQLKANLDLLNADWNPLLEEAKVKRASVERVADVVDQLGATLQSFIGKTEQNKASLLSIANEKVDDPFAARELEQHVERQHVELNALETLLRKLEDISSGPSTNQLRRKVENAIDDWNSLSKDVRNATNKAQHKRDVRGRFEKCKEEATALLNATKESCGVMNASSSGITGSPSHVTKETLTKALSEFENNWQRQTRELNSAAKELQGVVDREEAKAVEALVRELDIEFRELAKGMRDACGEFEKKDELLDSMKQRIATLGSEIRKITEMEMMPIGYDLNELNLQKEQCHEILDRLLEKERVAEQLTTEWRGLCDSGLANANGAGAVVQCLNDLNEQFNKARTAIAQRKRRISGTQQAVNDIHKEIKATCADLDELMGDQTVEEHVGSELGELRAQQENLRLFRDKLRPVGQRVEQAIANCENLIRSADKNVNTAPLECERKKLADVWNEVNGRLADRERQICGAMQELGSYSDAHNALLSWLQDTEESLANQRPPSTEHKVVKEQTRANDILLKHIEEKQQSVDGFKAMIDKVSALATDETHRIALKETSDGVTQRYANLLESAHTRRARLHEALILAEEWSRSAAPLRTWLDATEKSLQQLGKVPTDEEKLQQQIYAHQLLQEDISGKQWEFDRLVELCPRLAELTSVEEATELDVALRSLISRYENLVSRAAECGVLLQQMAEEIGSFLEHTNALSEWLDRIEDDIDKIDSISIYPDELIEQSSLLTKLAMAVTEQEALVSTVVEDGRELCRQTTGDEAIALQSRIEALRTRYTELASVTDSKIAVLSEALPLSERFHDGCETVQQWMDAVEQDMHSIDQAPLEAQSAVISQMKDDLGKWRTDVNDINAISKQLQQLSSGPRADELDAQTDDLNRRFNILAEQVTRKAEKLTSAEKQSRQVLDELDYLSEWFAEARDRLMQASAPAVDPDYVRKQLKNQKQMNEDIAVMKARLRDAAADAQKVTRALGDEAGGQDSLLASKIESGRALSADAAQMGEERLGELEQALALCQEVDQSFGELHSWLEKIENEIDNCPSVSTGNQRDQLMMQQAHNADLQQSIQAQRPLMDRFNKNVNALRELCDSEDAAQLEKIAEGIEERFEAAREAVRQRAEALETAIEHSSQFTDRLDVILANLGGAAAQIRNPDPVSADPERIRSQICDNIALMEELKRKEGALESVKESARGILEQAKPNDAAIADIGAKIAALDSLWEELNEGVTLRGNILEETYKKAERFCMELQRCQKALDELRSKIDDIQPATGQPSLIEQQRTTLMGIEVEMNDAQPLMSELRVAGRDLCEIVADEERAHVEQQIGAVEDNWATVTDIFARKNADLVDAMEKAMDFHGLLSELLEWLNETEEKVSALAPISSASPADIQNELQSLEQLRSVLDEKAIQKEQLNQMCANLCADVNAHQHQSAVIRAPINDLNSRWNRLYASLNERQQKMERALLEMGQFSQAYEQLIGWIEKTEHVLDEIDPRPTNLKQVEIEVCKHKVIQNDVLAHETSVDTVNAAAKRIINADPHSTSVTQPMVDELNARWHTLVDKLEDVWEQLTEARKAAKNLGGEMDRWTLWLQDKDADLSHTKPCGGVPETAHAQLDDFLVLKAEIEQNRPELEAHLEASEKYLQDNAADKDTWVAQREAQLKKKWAQVQEKMADREQKLRIALAEAEQLHSAMSAMVEWLDTADSRLSRLEPVSRIPDTLEKQMNTHAEFQTEVCVHRELMGDMTSKGTKLQYYCEKKDAIPIKNLLVTAKHRFDKVVSRSADRTKQLDIAFQEARLFFDAHADLSQWIASSKKWLDEQSGQRTFGDRVRGDLERHKDFQRELASRQPMYDTTYKRGKSLSEHAPRIESATIGQMNEMLREQWTQLCSAAVQRQRDIEEALLACGQFDEALSSLREWLEKELPLLQANENESVHGDLDTVTQLSDEHKALMNEIKARQASLQSVRQRAEKMLSGKEEGDDSVNGLREKLEKLNTDWSNIETLATNKETRLKEALADAESFNMGAHAFLDWLPRIEARLRMKGRRAEGEMEILEQMDEVAQLRKEMDDEAARLDDILKAGKEIYAKCHPLAEQPMKCWLRILQARWDEVSQAIDSKRDDLEKQLTEVREQDELIAELMKFITIKDAELRALSDAPLPDNIELVERLIADHEEFEFTLRERQSDVDDATKGRKKPVNDDGVITKSGRKLVPKRERSVRHPKSDQLSDRWKKLWIDCMEYAKRLREMKEYLDEVKKLESFTFEEWRERYLEWTDSGKARISDLFRRIDKSGTGRVPRSAFTDGIIASKFPTTRLEMEKVADEFDKGDGLIDAKEFMARLRSDFGKKLPIKQKTDGEKINEEVIRQSERCSCHSPYKIQKVGEGHYRFGDTQIKRMVRILRSTVMVRVGGGWVALDEFLHKHDPCRAKGRTNIEMQRGFYDDVRPEGAFDTMKTFTKSSRSTPNRDVPVMSVESLLGSSRFSSTPGPITKIREKTERSMPMHAMRRTSAISRGSPSDTPRSTRRPSDVNAQDSKIARPSTPTNVSRSGSRGDMLDLSRPTSRCSEASESSERRTRIPSLRGRKGVNYRNSNSSRASPNLLQ